MDIVKYFYEEPAALEALAPNLDPDARGASAAPRMSLDALLGGPDYYRGYLAGTDLSSGRVGATALRQPEAFAAPLMDWLSEMAWARALADGTTEVLSAGDAQRCLRDPSETSGLACAQAPFRGDLLVEATGAERRYHLPALHRLLAAARVAFFPEPAHEGFDWSFFATTPMRAPLTEAFRRHAADGVRRFVLPFQRARSEQKFYFEQWQLDTLPEYVEEV